MGIFSVLGPFWPILLPCQVVAVSSNLTVATRDLGTTLFGAFKGMRFAAFHAQNIHHATPLSVSSSPFIIIPDGCSSSGRGMAGSASHFGITLHSALFTSDECRHTHDATWMQGATCHASVDIGTNTGWRNGCGCRRL